MHFEAGTVETRFSIVPTPDSLRAIAGREHHAEAASVARLLAPRSVAVIGASRSPGKIGHAVVRNLRDAGFCGEMYAVNPNAASVDGIPTFGSVLEIPGPVDLAVIVRPAPEVPELVEQCARKGVHGLVVLSAGFAELDAAGAALQRSVVSAARANGMRVIGPNCLGIANPDPEVRLNATFASTQPVDGNVAFLSQSGGLGIELLEPGRAARHRDLRVRVGRQQERRERQRPAAVLGGRSPHRRDPPVPRVVREPAASSRASPAGSHAGSRSSP